MHNNSLKVSKCSLEETLSLQQPQSSNGRKTNQSSYCKMCAIIAKIQGLASEGDGS